MRADEQGYSNKKTRTVSAYQANYGKPATQIKKTDKSWRDIEARTGTPLATLTQLNQAKTIPPVGSFVLTQPVNNVQLQYSTPAGPPKPPTTNSTAQYYAGYSSGSGTPGGSQGSSYRMARTGLTRTQTQHLSNMQQQLSQGVSPQSVPNAFLNQLGFTPDEMRGEGYELKNGTWVYKGGSSKGPKTSSAGVVDNGDGTVTTSIGRMSKEFANTEFMRKNIEKGVDFVNQLRWDPERKKYVKIGDLIRQGKLDPKKPGTQKVKRRNAKEGGVKGGKHKAGSNNKKDDKPAAPTSVIEGPQTVLDIHLGSG